MASGVVGGLGCDRKASKEANLFSKWSPADGGKKDAYKALAVPRGRIMRDTGGSAGRSELHNALTTSWTVPSPPPVTMTRGELAVET